MVANPIFRKIVVNSINIIVNNKKLRKKALDRLDKYLYKEIVVKSTTPYVPVEVAKIKHKALMSMIRSTLENFEKGYISKEVCSKIVNCLVGNILLGTKEISKIRNNYKKRYGVSSPTLVTISPTKRCNLKCTGCYATSEVKARNKLDWDYLVKVMQETHNDIGIRFYVISGGEPLLYEDKGHTILDLVDMYPDSYFLMYTNGTLITTNIARRMAKLGNITPAISIEGMKAETDKRRGLGIFDKVLLAMQNLMAAGVPYGVSVTATKNNAKLLSKDKFYDYCFKELRVSYMWIFQYMPIGREITMDLMLTPKQRVELFKEWKKVVTEKNYFVADFWNSGMLSDGCISCGRPGGYFYIDWDGKIMPCVFVPYYKETIYEVYDSGRSLADALQSDLFVKGREWQEGYIGIKTGKMQNCLMPCLIRDHHDIFYNILKETKAKPENKEAKEALEDKDYHKKLLSYDKELSKLTEPIWESYKDKKKKVERR